MRVLVVSDIHANWEALRCIPTDFDEVFCLGDLVDYGPQPVECVEWVRRFAASAVEGNHDHAVSEHVSCGCAPSFRAISEATRELMWRSLNEEQIEFLRSRPQQLDVQLGGIRFRLVHATPSDPLYTYLKPADADRWKQEIAAVDADIILVGHTHLPMVLRFGDKLVVNPGSVGQPRDGDPRAAYAIIDDGEPQLMRAEYDVEATIKALVQTGMDDSVVSPLARILRTGGSTI